ncbi:DUF1294 domain-containing protein [Methylobrevis albus]|uniref:DUF1294 domain-containing protein n=1 Tax=Methylobrevis albus TaxID=2793297 RepID=A0A931I5N1_9HYPH|nr:DUF1294 domain-containing protein [Methylobrevis albus]MBH0240029.1 DUF1294 domain-containing protein [Methylobrevis albus]
MTVIGWSAALLALNLVTYLSFAIDKRRAGTGLRRIPERRLLLLAALGGSLGALLAQQLLRHKTRKQPFRGMLIAIVVVQVTGVVLLLVWPEAFWDA